MRVLLVPVDGGNPVDIQKDLLLVGRQSDCDLRLDFKTISKLHCVLVRTQGMLLLRDLGSTNGCRVNGQRLLRAALLPNDILSIADIKFRIEIQQDATPDVRNEPATPGIRDERKPSHRDQSFAGKVGDSPFATRPSGGMPERARDKSGERRKLPEKEDSQISLSDLPIAPD